MLKNPDGQPKSVKQAVFALWISIGVTLLLWISNYSVGIMDQREFMSALVILGLFCVLPFQIMQRNNFARKVCIVLTLFSLMIMFLGGYEHLTNLEYVVSLTMLPVDLFIVYQLLTPSASNWFSAQTNDR